MEQVTAPCFNCDARVVGCHGVCEKYKTYKKERAVDKQKISDCRRRIEMITSVELEAKRKISLNPRRKIRYLKMR